METVRIKQELIEIKQEPLDISEDPLLERFDETLLVPKIEVVETIIGLDRFSNSSLVQATSADTSLSCPKCHIRYYR